LNNRGAADWFKSTGERWRRFNQTPVFADRQAQLWQDFTGLIATPTAVSPEYHMASDKGDGRAPMKGCG
jgi:hypothetical protein